MLVSTLYCSGLLPLTNSGDQLWQWSLFMLKQYCLEGILAKESSTRTKDLLLWSDLQPMNQLTRKASKNSTRNVFLILSDNAACYSRYCSLLLSENQLVHVKLQFWSDNRRHAVMPVGITFRLTLWKALSSLVLGALAVGVALSITAHDPHGYFNNLSRLVVLCPMLSWSMLTHDYSPIWFRQILLGFFLESILN